MSGAGNVKRRVRVVLNERQRKALEYVGAQESITIAEYISLNKVSDKTARRDLSDLVGKRVFRKEGTTTGFKFKLTSVSFGQLRSDMSGGQ